MIKYEIEGGNLPVLICYPEAYQTLCTERGAMSWMSENMKMETNTGGGIKKMFGRMQMRMLTDCTAIRHPAHSSGATLIATRRFSISRAMMN